MFANVGDGNFVDIARPAGADQIKDSRGVAIADFDGDGGLDMAISNNDNTPTLYFNQMGLEGNWLALKLVGSQSNKSAVGAQVRLTAGGKTMTRQVAAGSGYSAQAMLPVHFGLGQATEVDAVEIKWPSGKVQRFDRAQWAALGINRMVKLEEEATLTAALDANQ